MKLHPIVDFQTLFPVAFNTLIEEHMKELEKYKHGSWVCKCGMIIEQFGECDDCKVRLKRIKQVRPCEECHKDAYPNMLFCNMGCYNKYRAKLKVHFCTNCNKQYTKNRSEFEHKNKFCSIFIVEDFVL